MKRTEDENPKQRRYEQGGSHAQEVKRALCLIPILLIAALFITYAAIRHNARKGDCSCESQVSGLFFAGQVNGTSGYEEAAAMAEHKR